MTPQDLKRKLTAILSADVEGYSRLMGDDEEGTIRTLNAYMETIAGFIQQHRGRVVSTGGDSVLAEFASVVDAVRCAVGIQEELKDRNRDAAEQKRMAFRIGINLGDVVEEGDTILGDGVNVAARVQSLAEAGGICISGTVYDQIKSKLALSYEYAGEQAVKNIKEPVRVYRVRMEPGIASATLSGEKKPFRKQISTAVLVIIAVLVLGGAATLYQFVLRPAPSKIEVASKEKMAFPLPDKPSIAVLPFVNMSDDPKQEYFCDGMTEGIITVLSKVPRLFVVARGSTFAYKGKPVKVKQVSEELGVRYVLEGSFQRSGDRIRITAQLIDALTGNHLWAERYDRDLKDLFALQDEVGLKILSAIRVKLTEGELPAGHGNYYGGKHGLDCYLKIMEGNELVSHRTIKDNNQARGIAEEVLALCPEVPTAYLLMAMVHYNDYWIGSNPSPRHSTEKAIELVQKALVLDDKLAEAHGILGHLYTQERQYDKGIAEGERAVSLDPGNPTLLVEYGTSLNFAGRYEEAITLFQKGLRLNPADSYYNYRSNHSLGNALLFAGRYEEAVSAYKKAIQRNPNYAWDHLMLAATYSIMDREQDAQAEVTEVLRIDPEFSLDFWAKRTLVKDQSVKDKVHNALRKAGLK